MFVFLLVSAQVYISLLLSHTSSLYFAVPPLPSSLPFFFLASFLPSLLLLIVPAPSPGTNT
jgi:hypothetical protein